MSPPSEALVEDTQSTDQLALWSAIASGVGLVLLPGAGLVGIVLGILALVRHPTSNSKVLAIVGIVLGVLGLAMLVFMLYWMSALDASITE